LEESLQQRKRIFEVMQHQLEDIAERLSEMIARYGFYLGADAMTIIFFVHFSQIVFEDMNHFL
jgi:hypothetical protein